MKTFYLSIIFTLSLVFTGCGQPAVYQTVSGEIIDIKYVETVNVGAVLLGTAVGGVAGNQFGKGRGKKVATGVGAIAGGVGTAIATANTRQELYIKTLDGNNYTYLNKTDTWYKKGTTVEILLRDSSIHKVTHR